MTHRTGVSMGYVGYLTPAQVHCNRDSFLASADVYQEWLDFVRSDDPRSVGRNRTKLTGERLRRAVLMKRKGYEPRAIAEAAGVSASTMNQWMKRLPDELKP